MVSGGDLSPPRKLSDRTKAEMARGANAVTTAEAWAAADRYESFVRGRLPKGYEIHTMVNALLDCPDSLTVSVRLRLPDGTVLHFAAEEIGVFPSDTLKTQIILVVG